ncbi:MAG: helix-turn-helix transcriptional regulator [Clostridia bacterium]|nr:helix-turn-helix transcriptional regulator [Clostridia bacterium]
MNNRIRELRKASGLTLGEFAEELGIARATLGFWEQGRFQPSNDMLITLADRFGVSVDYLLGRDEDVERDLKVALFGGDGEVTDEMWEEVKKFAEFVKAKNK